MLTLRNSTIKGKGEITMMDIGMIALLVLCFLSMKWFADWCEKQTWTASSVKEEEK